MGNSFENGQAGKIAEVLSVQAEKGSIALVNRQTLPTEFNGRNNQAVTREVFTVALTNSGELFTASTALLDGVERVTPRYDQVVRTPTGEVPFVNFSTFERGQQPGEYLRVDVNLFEDAAAVPEAMR